MGRLFLLFCMLCFCALSCGRLGDTNKKVFRYNQVGGLETLDPAFAKNLSIMWGVHQVYNTLLEADSALAFVPSLAQSWELSPDGLLYTFHLRNDVYFQDNEAFEGGLGRKMTAHDVVFSFERLIDPATASAGAWIFNGKVRAQGPFEATNDSTFLMHLKEPFEPMLGILTMPYCSIIPHEAVRKWGKDFRNHPCGTGAFALSHWDEGNVLVLKRNPRYWEEDEKGGPLPYMDAIMVTFHETRSMEFLLFQQGKLDFINGIDGSMKDLVLNKNGSLKDAFKDKITLAKRPYLNTEYLGIRIDTAHGSVRMDPLKSKKIRQAMHYAIDKQKIVTYFRNGVGIPADRGFVPTGLPGMDAAHRPKVYGYDPSKAAALLKEAGFPGGVGLPEITLTTPDAFADLANYIAAQLNDVGIQVKVQVMMAGLLRQLMAKSQVPFFKAAWIADYPDAESFLACFFSEFPSPPNYTRFDQKQYDAYYRSSTKADNDSVRYELYRKMDSVISDESPVIPLFYDEMLHFTQKDISGLRWTPLNIVDFKRVARKAGE